MKPFQTLFQSPEYEYVRFTTTHTKCMVPTGQVIFKRISEKTWIWFNALLEYFGKDRSKDLLEKGTEVTIITTIADLLQEAFTKTWAEGVRKMEQNFKKRSSWFTLTICSTYMHFRMYLKLRILLEQNILTFRISEETPNLKKLDTVFQDPLVIRCHPQLIQKIKICGLRNHSLVGE